MTAPEPVPPRSRRRPLKRARRTARYVAARAAVAALAHTPRALAQCLLGGAGDAAFWLMPRQRRLVRRQLDVVYRDRPVAWRRSLARRVFRELGRSAADVGLLARRDPGPLRRATLLDGTSDTTGVEGGAVVVSAHYGPWELLAAWLSLRGFPTSVVVRPNREARLDALLRRLRGAHGVALVDRGDGAACRRALRTGRVLVLAGDQRPRGRRTPGHFLGRPAWLPTGPATLADLCSRPLVPMIIRRTGDRDNRVTVGPVVRSMAPTGRERAVDMTRAACRWLEGEIARDAAQWAWFHERWPDAPDGALAPGGSPFPSGL